MVKSTTIGSYQDSMRADMEAAGDADGLDANGMAVERDPLSGELFDDDAGLAAGVDALDGLRITAYAIDSLQDVIKRVERKFAEGSLTVDEEKIRAIAERIWSEMGAAEAGPGMGHTYSVESDGTVRDWRAYAPAREAAKAADDDQADDEPRFSGGGTRDDDLPFTEASKLIPSDASFNNRLFKAAPELANIAERLIGEHGFLDDLHACTIDCRWRRKGGGSKGKAKIGYLKRVSGELTIFTTANFILWLAADTARTAQFDDLQIEAAVFHQLLHIGQDDKGNWIKIPHDFEGFGTEVTHYGAWTADLKIGREAFSTAVQLGLDLDADDEDDGDEDLDDDA